MSVSAPLVCHDCWPTRAHWHEPCPHAMEVYEQGQRSLGATGRFPDGKLGAGDEGELRFAVTHDAERQLVTLDFGKSVAWVALSPEIARAMAMALQNHASAV